MIMAVQPVGGVSVAPTAAPTGASASADAARRADPQSKDSTAKDSTVVISRITKTKDDGSTVTTTTYADGHTKIETTPPKVTPTELNAKGSEQGGRVTAVDILA
jgi:hypothetical protein